MDSLLGKIFFIELPTLPGFQLALVVAVHEGGVYRCKLVTGIESQQVFFFMEEAELLPLKPASMENFDRIDWVALDEQQRIAEALRRRFPRGVMPITKMQGPN